MNKERKIEQKLITERERSRSKTHAQTHTQKKFNDRDIKIENLKQRERLRIIPSSNNGLNDVDAYSRTTRSLTASHTRESDSSQRSK